MSTMTFNNSQEAFIAKHMEAKLAADGFNSFEINRAVEHGITFYRTNARFARGKVFDECLARARQLLAPSKKSKKKK
ncbi:TPA: hypothetical protein ACGUPM_002685 [Vibrio vulnificus]